MLQAKTQDITNVIKLPRRSKAKAKPQRRQPRRDITKAVTASIALRDAFKAAAAERREIEAQIAAAASEDWWGGLRSLALLTLISAVMIGMLCAGVQGG